MSQAASLLQKVQRSHSIPEKPYHGPGSRLNHPRQAAFVVAPEKEVLYGGAAGGGKSSALPMAALMFVDVPGYTALLIRKSFPQLEMSLMKRAREWLGPTEARWNEQKKTWTFPSGAQLRFGHMGDRQTMYDYQGAEFDFVGFDELTQFNQVEYEYLFSRLRRRVGSLIPVRMRAGSHPGGIGHEWVKQKFVVELKPGQRRYIPATLDDNPFLDRDEYLKTLDELDPVTYEQLRPGNWDVLPSGGYFRREKFQVVEPYEVPDITHSIRFWDMAAGDIKPGTDPDWCVGTRVGRGVDGVFYVLDVVRFRKPPKETEETIAATANHDGRRVDIWIEQEPGSSGVIVAEHYKRHVLAGYAVSSDRPTGSKVERAKPWSAAVSNGLVRLVRAPWNGPFVEEHVPFPTEGIHDDQVDSASGAFLQVGDPAGADSWLRYMEKRVQRQADQEYVPGAGQMPPEDQQNTDPDGWLEYLKRRRGQAA